VAAILAHRGAADESLGILLLFAAMWVGWTGWSRLRGRGFARLPSIAGPGLLIVGVGLLVAAVVVPPVLFPPGARVPGPRPTSTATLAIRQPEAGSSVDDGRLEVVLDLEGGTIVDDASADLAPDTGHIHVTVDGRLVSMTYGVVQVVDVRSLPPGEHELRAEYVAADHAPFSPRVVASVAFRTEGSA
jgi:hypothetical protein